MSEESKEIDPKVTEEVLEEGEEASAADEAEDAADSAAKTVKKKKKSKAKKLKEAITGNAGEPSEPKRSLTREQFQGLLEINPALKSEVARMDPKKVEELMKGLTLDEALTGTTLGGKNQKDMASYKFWNTQPVPSFSEIKEKAMEEGPIKTIDIDKVPKEPAPMHKGFEWVTVDITDPKERQEVYELLTNHYVEDGEATFRFNYSGSFLNWALKAPGWRKSWHVGVRVSESKKLVAFISAIPVDLKVRKATLKCSEVNYLCVHKKLRDKRLAPVLIKEITRRCYLEGVFQAVYTAGALLPTPFSTCRYFHRSLDWEKLHEVGFSPLPHGSTPQRQIIKYRLPTVTATEGLRPLREEDCEEALDLLQRYLGRFEFAPEFTLDEFKHWLLHDPEKAPEQVVWAWVVEDRKTKKITDLFSFYRLESTAMRSQKYKVLKAAYLFYYATETAFDTDKSKLEPRLNLLVKDALILAKKENFDVLNALTLLDNPLFLEKQLFGAGDGHLHYYMYNYRTAPIPGGVDAKNRPSAKAMGGIGLVML
ncbi:Glycylpeptide N-tetradecanoyltransferase [Trichodelitschia bisporula]|uniref:Glycylpeptide N-tetradecanoyltransferase n=1 Tax=Trichodelitschia bisporula TaxID=703511 RepID=A0A6G1I3R1_9PEZI|nr:Glycylpeptide N-tetradecanoyltransferase [Trichodelitschia bisporula]